MRTVLFLVAGFLLLAAAMLLGKLFSSNYPSATLVAMWAFVLCRLGLVLNPVANEAYAVNSAGKKLAGRESLLIIRG
jgi:hypothetical protein